MPFCPQCRDEFEDWVEACPDCKVALVEALPPLPPKQKKMLPEESLVVVDTYNYPLQAHLARTKLESEGIEGFVADEHMITANWLYSIAVGGVKLWVKESDAEKAMQVLESISPDIRDETVATQDYTDDERCPRCKSINIDYQSIHTRRFFFFWLIFYVVGLPLILPFFKRKWKCNSCGYEWKMRGRRGKNRRDDRD
jgi:hypothetical protein